MMKLSVIIPTFNPHPERFKRTIQGLLVQSLYTDQWECVVVDNNSAKPIQLPSGIGSRWKVVSEKTPGLSWARKKGIEDATADILVFVDDDNVLDRDYLKNALAFMQSHAEVGVMGGRNLPIFEVTPPDWFADGIAPMGCHDFGDKEEIFSWSHGQRVYPPKAPVGAGMVFRREAIKSWLASVGKSGVSDRKGSDLSSAGDCDMVLHALSSNWSVAYAPELLLHHLIPKGRLTKGYLSKVSRCAFRDFIKVLDIHGIRPWAAIPRWSVPLRSAKAWLAFKAWRGSVEQIRWQSAIGQFEGRSALAVRKL
jgi:glycosyltransferase involved in cell wall biosynthesis